MPKPTAAIYLVAGCTNGRVTVWPLTPTSCHGETANEPLLLDSPWEYCEADQGNLPGHVDDASRPCRTDTESMGLSINKYSVLDVSMLCNKLNILLVSCANGSATYQLPHGISPSQGRVCQRPFLAGIATHSFLPFATCRPATELF